MALLILFYNTLHSKLILGEPWDRRGLYRMVVGLQLPVQPEPITTKVVNSNPVYDEVYSIQYYVIKFVSYLRQSVVFSGILKYC